jgi:hypothetical protein
VGQESLNILSVSLLDNLSSFRGLICSSLQSLLLDNLSTTKSLSIWVQTIHDTDILQWVLALRVWALRLLLTSRSNNSLDFIRVDKTWHISIGNDRVREFESLLQFRGLSSSSKQGIELLKGGLGPDAESAHVATGSQLEKVESRDRGELDTGDIAEGAGDTRVFVVDDEGSATLTVATVAELTLTGAELLGCNHLLDISVGVDGFEKGDGFLGLAERLNSSVNDERDL